MEFSQEQQDAFELYRQGKNVFVTGPGGTGKTELIRRIYQHAVQTGKEIHCCALTGCAAVLLNCNAKTLHSWSGIGLGAAASETILSKIRKNKHSLKQWKSTEVLIVDEVSMMSLKMFDMLDYIGKAIRRSVKPFGGIQLVFSGDFYQLPPVGNDDDPDSSSFCFESAAWNQTFDKQIRLVKIFRQRDPEYASILNQVREGVIRKSSNARLEQCVGRTKPEDRQQVITKLFPTRQKVDFLNRARMEELNTAEERVFPMKLRSDLETRKSHQFTAKDIEYELEHLSKNLICDQELKLKIGAQVMCIVNIAPDKVIEICNGSQGLVTGFCPMTGCPVVKYNNGLEQVMTRHTWTSERIPGVGVQQVPLILAWALTIHKSQGATLDAAEIDVGSGIFECGQTYVALSRVKSLEGLYLTSYDVTKIKINRKVKEFYSTLSTF
jgi:ATP-dependent DNA helicase PIF1